MAAAAPHPILRWLRAHDGELVGLLERLAAAESPSLDPASQRGPYEILAAELDRIDYLVRPVRGHGVGDHLYAHPRVRPRGGPRQLLIGHMDTVWPIGTLAEMPIHREGRLLFGPGVADMKGGLVEIVFALRALHELGLRPSVTPVVLVNTDEEIGSLDSDRLIRLLAQGAERAFVLESGEGADGKLKIARKGLGRFTVTAHGRSSHAGADPEHGISAILELSYQVQRLFALNDPVRGVTVNVGTIDGGLRPNVVAPGAHAAVDVRVPTATAARTGGAGNPGPAARPRRSHDRGRGWLRAAADGAAAAKPGAARDRDASRPRRRAVPRGCRARRRRLGCQRDEPLHRNAGRARPGRRRLARLRRASRPQRAARTNRVARPAPPRAGGQEPARRQQVAPERATGGRRGLRRRVAVRGTDGSDTNTELVAAWQRLGIDAALVGHGELERWLRPGDAVLGRLDCLPTLDGVQPGLLELFGLERNGYRVINGAFSLAAAHDKLLTARLLARAGLPHPRTAHLRPNSTPPNLEPPLVVKPRHGSWGADIFRCDTEQELRLCLEGIRTKPWFLRYGALLQELVPPVGHDLRLLVAAGAVVGSISRVAAAGEWRTNISLGGSRQPARPSPAACALGIAAAAAIGADLVGVDLLPAGDGYS